MTTIGFAIDTLKHGADFYVDAAKEMIEEIHSSLVVDATLPTATVVCELAAVTARARAGETLLTLLNTMNMRTVEERQSWQAKHLLKELKTEFREMINMADTHKETLRVLHGYISLIEEEIQHND